MSYSEGHEGPAADPQIEGSRSRDHQKPRKGAHVAVRYRGRQTTVPIHGDRDLTLAERLRCDPRQVRRVLDLDHHSRLDQVEAALSALGKRLVIEVQDAA